MLCFLIVSAYSHTYLLVLIAKIIDIICIHIQATLTASKPRESLWILGYRGLNDYPFWIDDPEYNTPRKRGALISQAMACVTFVLFIFLSLCELFANVFCQLEKVGNFFFFLLLWSL